MVTESTVTRNERIAYSVGIWIIKPGREQDFISTWTDLVEWAIDHGMGAIWGTLVQDIDEPRRFISFGPWESMDRIKAWRDDPKYKEFMMRMRAFCETGQPMNLKEIGHVERMEGWRSP